MPIKGLTDGTSLPQIGFLRKGAPKEPGRPGQDLDYFRFEALSEEDTHLYDQWGDVYGSKPKRIEVEMPYATADECFDAWMEAYTAGAMQRRCDGEQIVLDRGADGQIDRSTRPCESPACECQRAGRLFLLLPIFDRLGTVVLTTSSVHDIRNLSGSLRRYEAMARKHSADLRGIPFWLERYPREISTPGKDGKRVRRTKYLVRLEPAENWVAAKREQSRLLALAPGERVRQLQSGVEVQGRSKALPGRSGGEVQRSDVQEENVFAEEVTSSEFLAPDGQPLADETEVEELVILCNDEDLFDSRAQRITFISELAGYNIESTNDLSHESITYVMKALGYICEEVKKDKRQPFVAYVLKHVNPTEWTLTDPRAVAGWVRSWQNFQAEMAAQEAADAVGGGR